MGSSLWGHSRALVAAMPKLIKPAAVGRTESFLFEGPALLRKQRLLAAELSRGPPTVGAPRCHISCMTQGVLWTGPGSASWCPLCPALCTAVAQGADSKHGRSSQTEWRRIPGWEGGSAENACLARVRPWAPSPALQKKVPFPMTGPQEGAGHVPRVHGSQTDGWCVGVVGLGLP